MNPYSLLAQGGVNAPVAADWRTVGAANGPELGLDALISRQAYKSVNAIERLVRRFTNRSIAI